LRIEKHPNTAYISHSGLTIFVNRKAEGFEIKTTERVTLDQCEGVAKEYWRTVKVMDLTLEELRLFVAYLGELAK
jgi:hypothetical protein